MAEKATLLPKLPPVEKEDASPLAPTAEAAGGASEAVAVVPSEKEIRITPFQATTYGSFVLSFVLAGFGAVVLYRKATTNRGTRFIKSSKLLALALALTCLHGFWATYAYTNYLRQTTRTTPLSLTLLNWVVLGAVIGYISNRLIAKDARLKTSDAIIDAFLYVSVFVMVTLAVSDQIGPNGSLLLALGALLVCTAPLSRFFISCKRLKFNQQSADPRPRKSLLFSLVLLPAVLPLIALAHAAEGIGLGPALFTVNLLTNLLIVLACIHMLSALKRAEAEPEFPVDASGESPGAQTHAALATPAMDPLIEELLAEQAVSHENSEAGESPAAKPKIRPVAEFKPQAAKLKPAPPPPPGKMDRAGSKQPAAPKRPDIKSTDAGKPVPNSPKKVIAPAKPKKRF